MSIQALGIGSSLLKPVPHPVNVLAHFGDIAMQILVVCTEVGHPVADSLYTLVESQYLSWRQLMVCRS